MRLRTSVGSRSRSTPATVAVPAVGLSSVVSIRSVVVLPAPLGPRKPTSSPGLHVDVDPSDGLDGAAAGLERAGQPACVDH